ncbi:MAG: sigma-54 dependent transcriptional regulator [Myxococcota bacterium]
MLNAGSHSPLVMQVMSRAARAARSEASVLIFGESGTGKERLARFLHETSRRASGPFVVCDCAALPPNLVESELFGHAKGAFTGAAKARGGLFRKAEGGTLFIDEIGELQLLLQSRLLRALQEKSVRAVGADHETPVNVRVVAATHRDLDARVRDGEFRQDLYFRLAVVTLKLPPLRARTEDLPALVRSIVTRVCEEQLGLPPEEMPEVTSDFLAALATRQWPGNIRELENVLTYATVMCEGGRLNAESLPSPFEDGATLGFDLAEYAQQNRPLAELVAEITERIEKEAIRYALAEHDGRASGAIRRLGLSRAALYKKIKRYGL